MSGDTMHQFIVTLPSNASDDKFKQNRPSNYKTELSRPLELSDEWDVALVDIQYPLNWNNFTERTMIALCLRTDSTNKEVLVNTDNSAPYKLHTGFPNADSTTRDYWKNDVMAITKGKFTAVPVYTQPSYYSSVQQFGEHLASMFNAKLQGMSKAQFKVSYVMDPVSEHGDFVTDQGGRVQKLFFLTDNLYAMRVLGYEPSKRHGDASPEHPYVYQYTFEGLDVGESLDVSKGRLDRPFSIYVYSDIIKPQLVGDVHAPLLGVVPVFRAATVTAAAAAAKASNSDSLGYWSFNPPYYLPLRFLRLDTINVLLCTDEGQELKFEEEDQCKVVCRLHFQKRSGSGSL